MLGISLNSALRGLVGMRFDKAAMVFAVVSAATAGCASLGGEAAGVKQVDRQFYRLTVNWRGGGRTYIVAHVEEESGLTRICSAWGSQPGTDVSAFGVSISEQYVQSAKFVVNGETIRQGLDFGAG